MLARCQVLPLNAINLGAPPFPAPSPQPPIPLAPSLRRRARRPLKVWILTAAISPPLEREKAKEKALTPLRRNFPLINL